MTTRLRRVALLIVGRIRAGHPLESGDVERAAAKTRVDSYDLACEVSEVYSTNLDLPPSRR